MNKSLLFSLLIVLCGLNSIQLAGQETATKPQSKDDPQTVENIDVVEQEGSAAKRKRVVIVRPIILCDDDGHNPAAFSLPKKLVDRVYTKADLEFLYLPTREWHYSDGRQGKVNLDTILRRGWSNGMICPDRRIVTLLFVSNVDGNGGPLGRGLQNGNVCFVCLGPDPENNEPGMEEFVIAHEVGHCLNLRHTVDDPNVPDDLVNLQGDGPYEDRLAVDGLHDTQRDTVLKSLLVNDRIRFFSKDESFIRLIDETWEPYLSGATADMLRFSLGLAANDPIPESPEHKTQYARQRFVEFAADFTKAESEMLTNHIKKLEKLAGEDWPLVSRFPWNFVKVEPGFCSDFPHTRGLSIVLSSKILERMKNDAAFAMTILLHEKIHVLQRVSSQSFEPLYAEYGYARFNLDPTSASQQNLAQNPDALSSTWSLSIDGEQYFLGTKVEKKENHLVFAERLFPLTRNSEGLFTMEPAVNKNMADEFKKRFSIPTGFDHPNEVAAHTSRFLLFNDYLGQKTKTTDLQRRHAEITRREFKSIFGLIGDN